jgi:ADP-ribose pyrophosphatase YjhB (NUDIX family)
MKFCAECGLTLERQWVVREGRERHVCNACGTTHYQNPRVIVGCLVSWHDQLLMCRRAQEPASGLWTVPSGYLECGETMEEGAARETFEETGVVVDPASLELSLIINMTAMEQVAVAFRVEMADRPSLCAGAECLEAAFIAEHEIAPGQIAWHQSWGEGLKRFFRELRSQHYTIQLITLGSDQGVGFNAREYRIAGDAAAGDTTSQRLASL